MPYTESFDPALRILTVTVEGLLDPDSFDAAMAAITSATGYPANVDIIWDFRTADFSAIGSIEMRRILDIRAHYTKREGSFIALVVADDVAFGMSRMFQFFADGVVSQQLRVVRSLADAEQWILSCRPRDPR